MNFNCRKKKKIKHVFKIHGLQKVPYNGVVCAERNLKESVMVNLLYTTNATTFCILKLMVSKYVFPSKLLQKIKAEL